MAWLPHGERGSRERGPLVLAPPRPAAPRLTAGSAGAGSLPRAREGLKLVPANPSPEEGEDGIEEQGPPDDKVVYPSPVVRIESQLEERQAGVGASSGPEGATAAWIGGRGRAGGTAHPDSTAAQTPT